MRQEVIIWTDVDGVLTADPRLVPDARTLREISYNEAAEISLLRCTGLASEKHCGRFLRPASRCGFATALHRNDLEQRLPRQVIQLRGV